MQYLDVVREPVRIVSQIYANFDEALASEASNAMETCLAANPKHKRGKHKYDSAEFGLSEAGVRHHFREYGERFEIPIRS